MELSGLSCALWGMVPIGASESKGVTGGEDICVEIPNPFGRPVVLCGTYVAVMLIKSVLS
jgi:hypothetical protein